MRRNNSQLNQLNTIDFNGVRLSKFLNIVDLTPINAKKTKNNLRCDSLKATAKAMKTFYNIKPTIQPQRHYRWESVKNMADYVDLGNLSKRGEHSPLSKSNTPNKSRNRNNNNQSSLSLWDSLIDKTECEAKFSTIKTFRSSSQDRIKYFLNPSKQNELDISAMKTLDPDVTIRKQCYSRNKNGVVGSISKLLDTTPEMKIKTTPHIKKKNESTDFLNPDWNLKNGPVKKKYIDVEKVRVTKTYAGLCAPKKLEMNMKEIICYNAKDRLIERNLNNNYIHKQNMDQYKKIAHINRNSQISQNSQTYGTYQYQTSNNYITNINLLESNRKLSRNKTGTTISTSGYTRVRIR